MILPLQKFSGLLESMAAGVQGGSAQLVDFSVGSVLRALLEASAAAALWMQWLILQVLAMTRAATSTGGDLDSWMADFALRRLPGSASLGAVTLSRYTPGVAATIIVGTTIGTVDGLQTFAVVADATNPAWNGVGGYDVAPQAAGITVAAQALTAGTAGNVQASSIGVLSAVVRGIDTVTNMAAFTGGMDPETDTALRSRFILYINSRSAATAGAVAFAVATLQEGLRYVVLENVDTRGGSLIGHFWVVVDDGSGSPPAILLSNVSAAVDLVRPIGATYAVTGPVIDYVTIRMTVVTSNVLTKAGVLVAIQNDVAAWIAGLPIAGTLAVSKIKALAHDADPSVISVAVAQINGSEADVTAPINGVFVISSISVN